MSVLGFSLFLKAMRIQRRYDSNTLTSVAEHKKSSKGLSSLLSGTWQSASKQEVCKDRRALWVQEASSCPSIGNASEKST